jgi:hypothetical protein
MFKFSRKDLIRVEKPEGSRGRAVKAEKMAEKMAEEMAEKMAGKNGRKTGRKNGRKKAKAGQSNLQRGRWTCRRGWRELQLSG